MTELTTFIVCIAIISAFYGTGIFGHAIRQIIKDIYHKG